MAVLTLSKSLKFILWVCAFVTSILSLLFELIGSVTVAWLYIREWGTQRNTYKSYDNTIQTGIFFRIACFDGVCETLKYGEPDIIDRYWQREEFKDPPNKSSYQALAVMAMVFCFCAILFIGLSRFARKANTTAKVVRVTALVFCFLSFLMAVILWGRKAKELHDKEIELEREQQSHNPTTYENKTLRFPYSMMLFAMGGIMALIAMIPVVVDLISDEAVKNKQEFDEVSDSGSMMNGSFASYPSDDDLGRKRNKAARRSNGTQNSAKHKHRLSANERNELHEYPTHGKEVYTIAPAETVTTRSHRKPPPDIHRGREHMDPDNVLQAYALEDAMHESDRGTPPRYRRSQTSHDAPERFARSHSPSVSEDSQETPHSSECSSEQEYTPPQSRRSQRREVHNDTRESLIM